MSIAEKILRAKEDYDAVYEAGYEKGKSEGGDTEAAYEQGKADGKQAEWNAFWDRYQENGTKTDYRYGFCGRGWNEETFNPKYSIAPTGDGVQCMFRYSGMKKLNSSQVDFSQCNNIIDTFRESLMEELGVLDFTKVHRGYGGLNGTFNSCTQLRKIEKIIMPMGNTRSEEIQNNGFTNCTSLVEIRFEGKLFENQNFQWCPLSVESMKSIISCLNDYSGTSEEFSYRVIFKDECWEALEASGTAPTGTTWAEYIAGLGWNP